MPVSVCSLRGKSDCFHSTVLKLPKDFISYTQLPHHHDPHDPVSHSIFSHLSLSTYFLILSTINPLVKLP